MSEERKMGRSTPALLPGCLVHLHSGNGLLIELSENNNSQVLPSSRQVFGAVQCPVNGTHGIFHEGQEEEVKSLPPVILAVDRLLT